MKFTHLIIALLASFGLFDFNLRGEGPAAQIESLDGIGYDGITLPLITPKDLEKLAA